MILPSLTCAGRVTGRLAALVVSVFISTLVATAQSTDVAYPTPVGSNEISGRILPRDLGDARLTRHFYTFNGVEGDLVVTVESTGLNGDVDVFTASGLRPLAKVTLYAGLSPTRVSKSVYLRQSDALILRVEARTGGDTEGVYRVRFEGAFAPVSGALAAAPVEAITPSLPENTRRDRNVRRVTSSGARIEEPPSETAASVETREAASANETTAAPSTTTTPRPARRSSRPARTPATASTRRRQPRTTQPATNHPSNADETAGASGNRETDTREERRDAPARTTTRTSPRTRASRSRTPANRTQPSTAEAAPSDAGTANASSGNVATAATPKPVVTATRLVIETKDGGRIERDMTNVRRVTVENNQLVITRRDGRTERHPMANVLRMAIEP